MPLSVLVDHVNCYSAPLSVSIAVSPRFESLCMHWLKGGTCNRPARFLSSFFLPLNRPRWLSLTNRATWRIGVSGKTDDINRGMHARTCVRTMPVPPCAHSLADTRAVNHDGPGNVCFSAATSWKWYKSPVPPSLSYLCLHQTLCPVSLFILLLEHIIIPLSQEGACFFMYPLYWLPADNGLEDTSPF